MWTWDGEGKHWVSVINVGVFGDFNVERGTNDVATNGSAVVEWDSRGRADGISRIYITRARHSYMVVTDISKYLGSYTYTMDMATWQQEG